jgi:hypothetical protein
MVLTTYPGRGESNGGGPMGEGKIGRDGSPEEHQAETFQQHAYHPGRESEKVHPCLGYYSDIRVIE